MYDKRIKSLHVISGLWKNTGGPAASIPNLCNALLRSGCEITLVTLNGDMGDSVEQVRKHGGNVILFKPDFRHTIYYSSEMKKELPKIIKEHDLVHIHGLWEYPGWSASFYANKLKKPVIISPQGSLNHPALMHSRWKKILAGFLFDNRNLKNADCLIAQTANEKKNIRAYGLKNPVAVIPNGIEMAEFLSIPVNRNSIFERFPTCNNKRLLLYMGRIHPTKGLLDLAEAWGEIAHNYADWHLLIIGPDENEYFKKIEKTLSRYNILSRVTYGGPLYGQERTAALNAAEIFISPTHTESFGMAIGEALAAELPVITTYGAPWEGIGRHGCGWWVPIGKDSLIFALNEALRLPQEKLQEMGRRGREWVSHDFKWNLIAEKTVAAYNWVLGYDEKPDFIYLD